MSIYEILVFAALAGVAGFAYFLYRSDTRAKLPGSNADAADVATGELMFKQVPKDQAGNGTKPSP